MIEAIRLDPGNHVYRYDRARMLERAGKFAPAVVDYTEAIKSSTSNNRSKLYEARGKCYLALKIYDKAVDDFTSALARSFQNAELLKLRSAAYKGLGNNALSERDLQASSGMDDMLKPPDTLGR